MTSTADPLRVNCGVCHDVCKRGVKATCCNARACRNCAVKHISKNRTCWATNCTKVVTTNDVINDEEMRALIETLEDPGPINCTVCGEICKRGAILSCCKAPCCRSCGVKKVIADGTCWMDECGTADVGTDNLENDDVLREAVIHYMNTGVMDPNHLNILKRRQQKMTDETDINSKLAMKRKSLDVKPQGTKKVKLSSDSPVVYLELKMIYSHDKKPYTVQIGLSSQYNIMEKESPNQLVFFQPIVNPAVQSIKLLSNLKSLNLFRVGEKLLFGDKAGQKLECKREWESLNDALDFLEDVRSKYGGRPVTLVTYRNVTIAHLVTALNRGRHGGLLGRFYNIVGKFASLEDIFEEKNIVTWLPMKSLREVYKSLGNNVSKTFNDEKANILANILGIVVNNMAKKYNFSLSDHVKQASQVKQVLKFFPNLDVSIPLEPNTFITESSCNFDSLEPIVDSDENDAKLVKVSWRSLCFPIHNQPIIAELKNAKESVKFVKLKLSSSVSERARQNLWSLKGKASPTQVHWYQGKAFVFPFIYPGQELSYKRNSQAVQHLEDFKARSIFGEYSVCEGTALPLLTNKPVKLVVTKTEERETIYIGPDPTAIVVTLANLPPNVEITPEHAFVIGSSNISGIEVVSRFFGVRFKSSIGMNKARIVVRAKESVGKWILKDGQQIGTAALISEYVIPRVIEEAQAFENLCSSIQEDVQDVQDDLMDVAEMEYTESNVEEVYEEDFGDKETQPKVLTETNSFDTEKNVCNTVASTRLYAQGSNPVLVKLLGKDSGVKKFNVVRMEFSPEFKEMNKSDKTGSFNGKFKCQVFWVEENTIGKKGGKSSITVPVPYAFVDIKLGKKKGNQYVDYMDLLGNFTLASYVPITSVNESHVDLSMNVCVDFNVRNIVLDSEPRLVEVYLKFGEKEIEKARILEQIFFINKCNNGRVEVLTKVFKPQRGSRLAPQKTSTNDMKAVLVMKAKYPDDIVPLTGREVIAVAKVASPFVDLAKFCAVSGGGFEQPQQVEKEVTYDEEFGDLEMSYNKRGFQNNRGYLKDHRFVVKRDNGQQGMYQWNGRREEEFDEMELMRMRMMKYDLGNPNNAVCENDYQMYGRYEEEYLGNGRYYGEEEFPESRRCEDVGFESKYMRIGNDVHHDDMPGISRKVFSPPMWASGNEKKAQNVMPFQEETCNICQAILKTKMAATSHYNGKQHEKKVRLYWLSLWDRPLPSALTSMCSASRCDLCQVEMPSLNAAMAHYEGKPHAKKVRAFCERAGDDIPQRKVVLFHGGLPNEKKGGTFDCSICNISTTNRETLDMHMKGAKHKKMKKNASQK